MLSERLFRSARLCVVGNINRDLRTSPFPAGPGLLRDGETAVDAVVETVGGGGAISALAAASLGARVVFLGKVGEDPLGDDLQRALRRAGVSARLTRAPGAATGTSLALHYADGQRHFVGCHPASRSLAFTDLDLRALRGFRHLYRADLWFSEPMLYGGNARLFQAARQLGMAVSVDLNWDPHWGVAGAAEVRARKQAVRDALPWVSVAHGNARELKAFADSADLRTALRRLERWGAEAVVVHLGARGAGYYQAGRLVVEPPAPVRQVKQTTGTGDVLSVCMMLLHEQDDARGKLRLANRVVARYMEGRRLTRQWRPRSGWQEALQRNRRDFSGGIPR